MTNCKMFIDKLALMALDELSEDETRQVNKHLAECASCTDKFRGLQEVTSVLGATPADGLTEFEKLQIENAVFRRIAPSPSVSIGRKWVNVSLRLAAALALIALGYAGGIFSFESRSIQPEPLPTKSQLASLDWKENIAAFRLSPQGLKLIARGRQSLKSY